MPAKLPQMLCDRGTLMLELEVDPNILSTLSKSLNVAFEGWRLEIYRFHIPADQTF